MNYINRLRLILVLAMAGLMAQPAAAAWPGIIEAPGAPEAAISPIVVNTFTDDFTANGLCSLREAAESVRQNASVGGCALARATSSSSWQAPIN